MPEHPYLQWPDFRRSVVAAFRRSLTVTRGIRDRKTLRVNYPMANKKLPAGEANPATQQIDFYIRSPQQNPQNKPNREVLLMTLGEGVPVRDRSSAGVAATEAIGH